MLDRLEADADTDELRDMEIKGVLKKGLMRYSKSKMKRIFNFKSLKSISPSWASFSEEFGSVLLLLG